jgi:hypothetical protein
MARGDDKTYERQHVKDRHHLDAALRTDCHSAMRRLNEDWISIPRVRALLVSLP